MLRLWLQIRRFIGWPNQERGVGILSGHGFTLGLTIYPVARDTGSVNFGQQRMESRLMPKRESLWLDDGR